MDKNKIFITIAGIVGIFVFLIAAYYATNQQAPAQTYEELKQTMPQDHTKWSKSKKHLLIKYSDLQCPACQFSHTFMKSLETDKTITDNVTFVYRHYPIVTAHPYALDAAYASEAAAKQGKFYEMVDLIFESQTTWSKGSGGDAIKTFRGFAEKLKLNMEQYDKDVASDEVKKKIAEDQSSGNKYGVAGTPTFFLDGTKVNVNSYEDFRKLLQETAKES